MKSNSHKKCNSFFPLSTEMWQMKETSKNEYDWIPVKYLNILNHNKTQKQLWHCKDITMRYWKIFIFLFWALWTCLATSIKSHNANLQKLHCSTCLTSFERYCRKIANLLHWVLWETWSCLSIMIVSPCRKLWYPKCWN